MTGADLLVKILKAEGIRQCLCFPMTPIIEAVARAGMRVITTRQERVAGNMADGVSRSTNGREIGVFTVQALAGSENAFAGVAQAHTDSTPLLFLPAIPAPPMSTSRQPSTALPTTPRQRRWRRRCWLPTSCRSSCARPLRRSARAGRSR